MRNPILGIAIAIVFAASSQSALAGKIAATGSHYKGGTITVRKAGKGQQEYLRGSTGPTVPPKPTQGNILGNSTVGGSTGPTKPPLPTTGRLHQ
jgi:hypothetical protein